MFSEYFVTRKRRIALLICCMILVAGGVALGSRFWPRPVEQASGALGSKVPDFAMQLRKGNMMRLSDFSGRPFVILFWTSWAPSVREEFNALQAAYADHEDEGFSVLAVHRSRMELWSTAETFGETSGATFPILSDPTDEVYATFVEDGRSVPARIFVDRDRNVRAKEFGPMKTEEFLDHLATILRS